MILSDKRAIDALQKQVRYLEKENERLRARVDQLRGALKVIDSVVPSATPGNSDTYVKEICKKYFW